MIKEDYEQLVTTPYSLISKLWKFANGRFDASFFDIVTPSIYFVVKRHKIALCIQRARKPPFKFTILFFANSLIRNEWNRISQSFNYTFSIYCNQSTIYFFSFNPFNVALYFLIIIVTISSLLCFTMNHFYLNRML